MSNEIIKPSDFYEKYVVIKNADGTVSQPYKLTDTEKNFIDTYIDKTMSNTFVFRSTRRSVTINLEDMKKANEISENK